MASGTLFILVIVTRTFAAAVLALGILWAQNPAPRPQPPKPPVTEEEPPEEDESTKPTEYSFNPLQSQKELRIGNFYAKKGSFRAAMARYKEATLWDPSSADAYLKLGELAEKTGQKDVMRDAYRKYLELVPDSKLAPTLKKKIAKK
jgi:tetratricopeptide (TPR) repeat protein